MIVDRFKGEKPVSDRFYKVSSHLRLIFSVEGGSVSAGGERLDLNTLGLGCAVKLRHHGRARLLFASFWGAVGAKGSICCGMGLP